MGGRRQAEHVEFGTGVAETGDGAAPVSPVSKLAAFGAGDGSSILDEPWTPATLDKALIEDSQRPHEAAV
jgi:hypothetical protein